MRLSNEKSSIESLTFAVASLNQLMADVTKPGADVGACQDRMQDILKEFNQEEIEGLAKVIAGKQVFLPGYPDSVIMIEHKK